MHELQLIAEALTRPAATPAVLATLVSAAGSSYRRPGARLLVRADGSSVASEFAPKFPKQQANVSYGPAGSPPAGAAVYLEKPTPGAGNSAALPMGICSSECATQITGVPDARAAVRSVWMLAITASRWLAPPCTSMIRSAVAVRCGRVLIVAGW